jgi:hypothetical protein
MKTYKEIINEHWSKDFKEFAEKLTFKEFHETCERGDWMLWLFNESNPDCLKELTLAKGHCANTVRHIMKDERSIAAVDAAIAFGEGKITREELDKAADTAYATADDAAAAYAADAATATADACAARKSNQLETANICRKYLPIKIWNLNKENKEPKLANIAPESKEFEITQIRLHGKLYNLTEVKNAN